MSETVIVGSEHEGEEGEEEGEEEDLSRALTMVDRAHAWLEAQGREDVQLRHAVESALKFAARYRVAWELRHIAITQRTRDVELRHNPNKTKNDLQFLSGTAARCLLMRHGARRAATGQTLRICTQSCACALLDLPGTANPCAFPDPLPSSPVRHTQRRSQPSSALRTT